MTASAYLESLLGFDLATIPATQGSRVLEVPPSQEFRRIVALPRRAAPPADVVDVLTNALARPGGTMRLRPIQAWALHDLHQTRGLFASVKVGGGKAQPNTEPVLTENGWIPIGQLRIGYRVYGSDGRLHWVTGVFPQGWRPVCRIVFSDGTDALSDIDHLWTFDEMRSGRKHRRTLPLRSWLVAPLFRWARTNGKQHRINRLFLPLVSPIEYPERDLPLDPYTLGALLGDGGMTNALSFTSMDLDIVERLRLPTSVEVVPKTIQNSGKATDYKIVSKKAVGRVSKRGQNIGKGRGTGGGRGSNALLDILRSLGLHGRDSYTKFIPEIYKRGSVEQRLELLRGLCDTDGNIARVKVEFSTCSAQLASDIVEIVESLGGTAFKRSRTTKSQLGTECLSHRVNFGLHRRFMPFYCARKAIPYASRIAKRLREPFRAVIDVQFVGWQECTCISVNAPDRLYLTRNHVLTHNTILSYLAPTMVDSRRPLLLVPASLKEKTRRDFRELSRHFYGPDPEAYRIESYELLGRPQSGTQTDGTPGFLDRYKPDLIVGDECQAVANPRAACSKRLRRYLADNPSCSVVMMSGTPTKRSLRDYAPMVQWCIANAPVPLTTRDLEIWADALDEKTPEAKRPLPGVLLDFCVDADFEGEAIDAGQRDLVAARRGFRRRLTETPGCVATADGELGVALRLRGVLPTDPEDPQTEAHFRRLREDFETPDGHPFSDGLTLWRHARELAIGMYYRWSPRPPNEWIDARREWSAVCRDILRYNRRGLDSEKPVVLAVLAGHYPVATPVLERWRAIRPTFTPQTEVVWFSDSALRFAQTWLATHGGICWVEHVAFGHRLAELSGLPFFHAKGLADDGRFIEDASGPVIASIASNHRGRNLQHRWSRNLLMSCPDQGATHEQMHGRTHRDGQIADAVESDIYIGCFEHAQAFHRAVERSRYMQDSTGQAQKLVYADVDVPTPDEVEARGGFRWKK